MDLLGHRSMTTIGSAVSAYALASFSGESSKTLALPILPEMGAPAAYAISSGVAAFVAPYAVDLLAENVQGKDPLSFRVDTGVPSLIDPAGAGALSALYMNAASGRNNGFNSLPADVSFFKTFAISGVSAFVGDYIADTLYGPN